MKKRNAISTLAAAAALTVCSVFAAHAAGSYFLKENFYYGVKNKEVYVHGYEGTDWDLVIREKFLSYYVTSIEEYAFFENDTMTALSFYDATHLKSLGDCAFARCSKLQAVNITSSIQEMGDGVFDSCTALTYARFRAGAITEVPAQSFYGCGALETVIFENEVTSIGNLAFANCGSLKTIEIPDTVAYIADNAFDGCDDLVIYCTKDSYALQYAVTNGIDYYITDAESVTYLLGDTNGDGTVNIRDVTEIQRYLAELAIQDADRVIRSGDINGNGVDISDATLIQRYLAEFDNPYHIGEYVTLP